MLHALMLLSCGGVGGSLGTGAGTAASAPLHL